MTERVTDVKSSLSYALTLKKNEYVRSLRLIVGKKEFVEKNTNGIPIVPVAYSLDQNFPNPFNPSTKIHYTLGHSSHVELDILNVLGQKVKTLFSGDRWIGSYTMEWDGTNDRNEKISSGIYFYRIRTEEFIATKKMVLLK
jgi:FlgD Ig-like domain